MRTNRFIAALSLAFIVAISGAQARDAAFPTATPESVGFSSERLKKLDQSMQSIVDNKHLAGIVTVVARHGKIIQQKAYGKQDFASGTLMSEDTIFRIYSMTKPVVGAAMMMLYEEGKWRPSDPISRYIPEFANLKVAVEKDGQQTLQAPKRAPTMAELMSHTAGFTYGIFGNTPVDKMYRDVNPLGAGSLQEFIDKMATLPLLYEPGEAWIYSVSVDIQGYLVEKLSGQSLPDFLRERIFEPLGMKDTAFYVPKEKMPRLATIYSWNAETKALVPASHDPNVNKQPGMASGGGGLYSTAGDYLRFAQMLLNNGELNGKRLLSPSSIELMRSNRVPDHLKDGRWGVGVYRLQPGLGFGYDVSVFEDPVRFGSTAGKGSYMWYGAAGTWFWNDPTNDLIFIGMIQRRGGVPGTPNMEELARALTYQALVNPKK